jgi:hypothetical protein
MSNAGAPQQNLTGLWHGVYSYEGLAEPISFVATLADSGGLLSGTVEEELQDFGVSTKLRAHLDGRCDGSHVAFRKTYDGTGGWSHSIEYEGTLSGDALEVEGHWFLPETYGTFLMVRRPPGQAAERRRAMERVGERG